jgi:hypothetical protein
MRLLAPIRLQNKRIPLSNQLGTKHKTAANGIAYEAKKSLSG